MLGKRITFEAVIAQVKTMVDGGVRITFDLPETAIKQAAELMECKRRGVVLLLETAEKPPNRREANHGRPD